jgi:hypothetical protein
MTKHARTHRVLGFVNTHEKTFQASLSRHHHAPTNASLIDACGASDQHNLVENWFHLCGKIVEKMLQ